MTKFMRLLYSFAAFSTLAVTPAFANLIVNGSFETGDFTGWTTSSLGAAHVESSGFDGYLPEQGSFFFAMGNNGGQGTISQTFADSAGTTYLLSYYYASNGTGYTYDAALIDGVTLPGSVETPDPNSGNVYDYYAFTFVGTGSDTFTYTQRNDPSYDALDNISINAVGATPEPSSLVLLGTGVLSLAGAVRRKLRKA